LNGNFFKHSLTMTNCSNFDAKTCANFYEIEEEAGEYVSVVGENITKICAN
jgi:hypothetical protein